MLIEIRSFSYYLSISLSGLKAAYQQYLNEEKGVIVFLKINF